MKLTTLYETQQTQALNLKNNKTSAGFGVRMHNESTQALLYITLRAVVWGTSRVFLGRVVAQIVDCCVHTTAIKMQRQHINYCCVYKQVGSVYLVVDVYSCIERIDTLWPADRTQHCRSMQVREAWTLTRGKLRCGWWW